MGGFIIALIWAAILFPLYLIIVKIRDQIEKRKSDAETLKYYVERYESYHEAFIQVWNENILKEDFTHSDNYKKIKLYFSKLEEYARLMNELGAQNKFDSVIDYYRAQLTQMDQFVHCIENFPESCRMSASNYGQIKKEYWDSVSQLTESEANKIVSNGMTILKSGCTDQIITVDISKIMQCIWFYAIHNCNSPPFFAGAAKVFKSLCQKDHIDIILAACYAMQQAGQNDLIHDQISKFLELNHSVKEIKLIASGLMWIEDYPEEISVLSCMFNNAKHTEHAYSGSKNSLESCMMDASNYGHTNDEFKKSVLELNSADRDQNIRTLLAHWGQNNAGANVQEIVRYIWSYAFEKTFSVYDFRRAVELYHGFDNKYDIDVSLAEIYAMSKIGGNHVLHDRVDVFLDGEYSSESLTLIASGLMWMKAYSEESLILTHMLSKGMQMSPEAQKRLHALSKGGDKAPGAYDVASTESTLYFDIAALSWSDREYQGLFENLRFQGAKLKYSLAVREEISEQTLEQSHTLPDLGIIVQQMRNVFAEVYGADVSAELKHCISKSESSEEDLDSVLICCNQFRQMGILMHIVKVGNRLIIRFLTLFIPQDTDLEKQKQQTLILRNKLSLSMSPWESSIKQTALQALQQLLNCSPSSAAHEDNGSQNPDQIIF